MKSADVVATCDAAVCQNAAEYRRKLQRYIDTLAEPDRQPHMAELHAEMKKERKATKTPAGGDDGDDVQVGRRRRVGSSCPTGGWRGSGRPTGPKPSSRGKPSRPGVLRCPPTAAPAL